MFLTDPAYLTGLASLVTALSAMIWSIRRSKHED